MGLGEGNQGFGETMGGTMGLGDTMGESGHHGVGDSRVMGTPWPWDIREVEWGHCGSPWGCHGGMLGVLQVPAVGMLVRGAGNAAGPKGANGVPPALDAHPRPMTTRS